MPAPIYTVSETDYFNLCFVSVPSYFSTIIIIIIIIIICCIYHHDTTIKHDQWLDEACGVYEGEDKCVHSFSGDASGETYNLKNAR